MVIVRARSTHWVIHKTFLRLTLVATEPSSMNFTFTDVDFMTGPLIRGGRGGRKKAPSYLTMNIIIMTLIPLSKSFTGQTMGLG